ATVTMPNTSHAAPGVTSPTIFDSVDTVCYNGGGNSGGVLFCIDTSGSMHSKLPAVRSELVELLNRWSGSSRRFNLIRFGAGSLQRWSEGMVDCTPAAIVDADRWLSIGGTSGCCSDTRAALTTASVEAKNCGASSVCLVTDSLPEATLTSSEMSSLPLPVHCVYPKESELTPQPGLMAELQQIAGATGGSLTVANVSHRGVIERVAPVARTAPPATRWGRPGGQQVPPAINGGKLCSVTASLRCDPLLDAPALLFEGEDRDGWRFVYSNQGPPGTHWGGSWSKFQASRPRVRAAERGASPPRSPPPSIAGVSLLGRRVLARRRSDGLFYEGTVLSEASTPGQFNVELQTNRPKNCAGKDGFSDTEYQITPVGELIALDDALRRQLLPGDCVLAPRGPNRPDYGPAIVLDGYELRRRQAAAGDRVEDQPDDSVDDCKSGGGVRPLAVAFTDGASCVAEPGKAVRISHSMYHRLQLEAVMPRRERLALADWTPEYPEATRPGYLATRPLRNPDEFEAVRPVWPPGRMLPEAVPARSHRSGSVDGGRMLYDSAEYDEFEQWPDDTDRRADQLIADFDRRLVDASVGPEAPAVKSKSRTAPTKSILKKPPPAPSKQRSFAVGASTNWASENGFSCGYSGHRQSSRWTVRSANMYNRRPLEIGSCLGRGDLELETRQHRIYEHRRAVSAERADALLRSRADEESAKAARLARMAETRGSTAAAAVSVEETPDGRFGGRRRITATPPDERSRESRRRYVTPPSVPTEERPCRVRRVTPCGDRGIQVVGDGSGGGGLQRSVRFSSSEPTVTAWIKRQDHMTPSEVRSSAQQLAARHKDCVDGLERQRWSAAAASKAPPASKTTSSKKSNSSKSKLTSTKTSLSSASTAKASA
ncbi:hypothetical protein BOX15_Mlig008224g1, partial [Macrostomum lignano]